MATQNRQRARAAKRATVVESTGGPPGAAQLTRERLVEVTLDLINEVGVDGLTMARLGRALGTSAMAPYHHVNNKQELLELAADAVLAELTVLPAAAGSWDVRLRAHMLAVLQLQDRHPWFSPVLINRYLRERTETPNVARNRSATITLLEEAGCDREAAMFGHAMVTATVSGLTIDGAFRARGHFVQHPDDARSEAPRSINEDEFRRFVIDATIDNLRTYVARTASVPSDDKAPSEQAKVAPIRRPSQ